MYKPTKIDTIKFKQENPELYEEIKQAYSPICDMWVAIDMHKNNIDPPTCKICNVRLQVSKNMPIVCKKHINIIDTYLYDDFMDQKQTDDYITCEPWENVVSGSTKIKLNCSKHGDYEQPLNNALTMKCQKCHGDNLSIIKTKPYFEWLADAKKMHDDKYDYSLSQQDYINSRSKVKIICKKHGEFTQNTQVHISGHGCSKCMADNSSENLRMTTEEFIERAKEIHGDIYDYSKVDYINATTAVDIICKKHGSFIRKPYPHLLGYGCPTCGKEKVSFQSKPEFEIKEYIENLGFEVIHGDRHLGFELDLYIPEKNLAIEYNGIYWHSSGSKGADEKAKTQHLKKTEACEKNGMHLLHIFENEWLDNSDLWKSVICQKLGKSQRIYARKCHVGEIPKKAADAFMKANHLQGTVGHKYSIGLYHNNILVSVITLGAARYDKTCKFELLRMAHLKGYSVVGGFSKMIKFFQLRHKGSILSYANRRWSIGNVYTKTGFKQLRITGPCYYYVDGNTLRHRSAYMKHKLHKMISIFDKSKTEVENMYANNYRRIWDCGTITYIKDSL